MILNLYIEITDGKILCRLNNPNFTKKEQWITLLEDHKTHEFWEFDTFSVPTKKIRNYWIEEAE